MPKKIVIKKPQPKQTKDRKKKRTRFSSNVEINIIDSSKPRTRRNPKLDKQVREMQPLNIPVRPAVPQNILSAEQYDLLREKLANKEKEKKTDSKINALSTQNQLSTQAQTQTQQQLVQQLAQQAQTQQQLQQQLAQQLQQQTQSQQQLQQQLAQQQQHQTSQQTQLQQQLTQQQQHQQLVSTQNQNQIAQQHQAQLAQQFQRQEAFQQQLTNQQQAQSQQQLAQVQSQVANANTVNLIQNLPREVQQVNQDHEKIERKLEKSTDPEEKKILKIELKATDYHRDILLDDAKKQAEKAKKIEKNPTDPSIYEKAIEDLNQKISYLDGPDRAIMKPYINDYKSRKKDWEKSSVDPEIFGSFIEFYDRVSKDLKSGKFKDSKYLELFENLKKDLPTYGKGENRPITTKYRITKWMSYADALYNSFDGRGESKSPFRKKTKGIPAPAPAPKKESKKKGKKKKSEGYETFPEDVDVDSGLEVLRRRKTGRPIHEVLREPIDPHSHSIPIQPIDHLPPPPVPTRPAPPPPPPTPSRPPPPTPVSYATPKATPKLSSPWTTTGVIPSRPMPPETPKPKPKPTPKSSPTIIDIKPPTPISDVEVGSRRSRRSNSSVVRSDDDSLVVSDPPSSSSSSEEEQTVSRLQISRYKSRLNRQIRDGENPNPRPSTLAKYGLVKDSKSDFYIEKRIGRGLKAGDLALPRLSEDRPKDINRMLDLYGDWDVIKLRIVRKPLNGMIEKLANIVTKGNFEKKKAEINISKYFHLFMVLALRSPEGENDIILLEKNHRVMWKDHQLGGLSSNEEGMDVPLGSKSITLEEFIENGEANKVSGCPTYVYNAVNCNCQRYVKQMVSGSFQWTQKMEDFTIQDVAHSVPSLLGKFLKKVTNTASRLNYMVKGGENFNMYRYKGIKQ